MSPRLDAVTTMLLVLAVATVLAVVFTATYHRVVDFLADCRDRRVRTRYRRVVAEQARWSTPTRYLAGGR